MISISVLSVVSPANGAKGVNRYFYRKEGSVPRHADGSIDVLRAVKERGELVDFQLDIGGGGNDVPAFLELVCADHPVLSEARSFLQEAESALHTRRPPLVLARASFGLHFNTNIGLYPTRREELSRLAAAALSWLEHPPTRSLRDKEPFVVLVAHDEEGVTFKLDEASEQRLRALKGGWMPSPIHIAHHTLDDFERMVGGAVKQFGQILTSLDDGELLRAGGLRYVDASKPDKVLAQWPSRRTR